MSTYHVLYNPKAGSGKGLEKASLLKEKLSGDAVLFHDITEFSHAKDFLSGVSSDDFVIVSGGDGTLSRFINDIYEENPSQKLFYHASGSGNDFARDVNLSEDEIVPLENYSSNLPTVFVKGKSYHFINGIGYGIDGYCCEEGDRLRQKGAKSINYTLIAIKGLLFHYRPTRAEITVDGITESFDNVWLAPCMHGRFYGGGMLPCPGQRRENADGKVSVMVYHSKSKLRALILFPKIFTGKHIEKEKLVKTFSGHEITVSYDKPTPLQIDGETICDVLSYSVKSNKEGEINKKEAIYV